MPPAEDLVPDLDNNLDEPRPLPATTTAAESSALDTEEAWGLSASPPKASKRKKKGKKNAKTQPIGDEGDDSAPYPKSITPSPPTDGVRIQPAEARPPEPPPLVDVEDDFSGPEGTVASVTREPAAKPAPETSPAVRSPHPVPARPASIPLHSNRPTPPQHVRDRAESQVGFNTVGGPASTQSRRESFMAQPAQRPRFVEAPQPHLPQAHFFGLPDLGLGLGQKQESGRVAGADGYCCRLDSFADAGNDTCAQKSKEALLVGSDGALEVFRILPNKLELVGRIEGLRGAVIGAKILPHVERSDPIIDLRPLVAVVIHGPMLDVRHDSGSEGYPDHDAALRLQTTVDVYSLELQRHLATLHASAPVAAGQPGIGPGIPLPRSAGDFEVDAQGPYITVSSGKSGEVLVFTSLMTELIQQPEFRCIGKFWTAIQKPVSGRPSPSNESGISVTESPEEPQKAIYSLSSRWLTIVPPALSSTISLGGSPLISDANSSPPGLSTHAAPPPPPITCEVVSTDVEGAWGRLGRQAAQGLVKVSQKGFEMGRQGWKELTQPSPPGLRANHDRGPQQEEFPPTKAPTNDLRTAKEPALVSLIDLDNLLVWETQKPKYMPVPMSTFALLDGCNFVSLSSTGTRLLTSSRKGEVSMIWDLGQVAHGSPRRLDSSGEEASTCPSITQLLRVARNSPSTLLSCAWSRDDDAVAMLTNHGTIHLHEVPSRPQSRKRKRTAPTTTNAAEKADATVSLSTGLSPPSSGFLGSIKSWSQTVSTQVNSIRTTSPASAFGLPTTFAGFREATAAAGNAGSRAVARGLSQGLTAAKGASSDYWHADDNKIRHTKALQTPLSAKSVKWIKRNSATSVAIVCGGTLHVHPVQRVTRRKGSQVVTNLKHERHAHKAFPLPPIASKPEYSAAKGADLSCTGQGPHGFWSLRQASSPVASDRRASTMTAPRGWASTNDVETNAPYCPFHVGSQIGIYAFDEMEYSQYRACPAFTSFQQRGHGNDQRPWTFGDAMPPSTKINEQMPDEFRESSYSTGLADDDLEEEVASQMESKLTIQPPSGKRQDEHIRVSTRRKGRSQGIADDGHEGLDLMEDDQGHVGV
ncbi:hypothetical protein CB0940_01238 [Cercospora beticola]|uniref:Uncharacterized protein n=1 Tax=Cercospora beticola TaxID=122368 RepID=A0A2G5I7S0_CERBT|nr:hypothetical protein CB0940_01238 [Cercospora beticola]PIB00841.1 hypothetical protein CB0940_01238 [Cercospora beticola]WPA96669.1 hypothetical protein RHO25_001277 [Cercospora beticola]